MLTNELQRTTVVCGLRGHHAERDDYTASKIMASERLAHLSLTTLNKSSRHLGINYKSLCLIGRSRKSAPNRKSIAARTLPTIFEKNNGADIDPAQVLPVELRQAIVLEEFFSTSTRSVVEEFEPCTRD